MTCRDCEFAELHPLTDKAWAGCLSCSARLFVLVGLHSLPPGQAHQAMRKQFGDKLAEGKALVDKWAGKVRRARATREHV